MIDEPFSPSKRPDVAHLWKTQRERNAWLVRGSLLCCIWVYLAVSACAAFKSRWFVLLLGMCVRLCFKSGTFGSSHHLTLLGWLVCLQADLRQSSTASRLAYCAAVLAQQAAPLLATLAKASGKASGKKGKGKGKASGGSGAKAAADVAPRASVKAAAPVSRTNSSAQLDASDSKGKGKGGKRKAAAPPPENMRTTRARA